MKKLLALVLSLLVCSVLFADVLTDAGITVQDLEEVITHYKTLAEAGDAEAYETEFKFLKAAAELGSSQAMIYLGELYQGGFIEDAKIVEDPIATAFYWWNLAARNGQSRAWSNMGLVYEHKAVPGGGSAYGSIPYNPSMAYYYYKLGCDEGDTKSARYVALCYQNGVGVPQSYEKAREYFKLAVDRQSAYSYYAEYLLKGIGGEQDVDGALALYQKVVDENGHDALSCALILGDIYKNGVYVEKDAEKAAGYYELVIAKSPESKDADLARAALAEL